MARLMTVAVMSATVVLFIGLTAQQEVQGQQIPPIPPPTSEEGSERLRNAADLLESAGFLDIAADLRRTADQVGGDFVYCQALGCPGSPPDTGVDPS